MILLCWYKRYRLCLISFFNLHELFAAFICGNNIESLFNNFFGDKTFNPVPVFFLFWEFSFNVSAIVFSGSNLLFHHLLIVELMVNHLQENQELSFQVYLEHLSFSSERLSYWVVYILKSLSNNLEAILIITFLFRKSFYWSSLFELISSILS